MKQDHDWTTLYCGVSHYVKDKRQFTIEQHGNSLVQLFFYDWAEHTKFKDDVFFFVKAKESDDIDGKNYFWNCGTIDNAIAWAKHYAEHNSCHEMEYHKNDLSRFLYHLNEYEKKVTT